MRLKEVLSVLSKSSPYAVSTERKQAISKSLDDLKDYLYIKTEIEDDFRQYLTALSPTDKKIIFLCGSSGDGKSEILTRYSRDFSTRAKFHLDATHSFSPSDNAIQTLDHLFSEFESGSHPLVVGINIGMLSNYAEEGDVESIKEAIKLFLEGKETDSNFIFLDFESYPKFELNAEGHASSFAKSILEKITAPNENIIRQYFDMELQAIDKDKKLCTNYQLLSLPEVQDRIIDILFKARLMKDQFLTARTLLDFINTLLAGDSYLFDNLFEPSDNELSSKIVEFDPSNLRTSNIDKFILSLSLGLLDEEFDEYASFLSSEFGIRRTKNPYSYLRLFYLLKDTDLGNGYHKKFSFDFSESLLDRYSKTWNLHNKYDGNPEDKKSLRLFYRDTLIAAIHRYNNRNATNLDKGQFLISSHNGYQVVTEVDIKPDLNNIRTKKESSPSTFTAFVKLNDKTVEVPVNINLLNLMESIVNGYRPNKHDKNTVVLLDEFADELSQIAAHSKTLLIVRGNKHYKVSQVDEDIEVSGV
ncbi:DNA phosphorothioation-dependent restriction protein DptF [Psychrobium sp. MM17-31]|uniref:DNA phosphorothioation-dependent restriction protein DptF n=1 Tax=Psychrobium sp. MM17-31 TaxID=2917758 RepID=UPI001EF6A665|nr:DNA phosphorothioation-dependent restriction protein DptF [Psychrobium sp. MM17-31]